IYVEESGNPEGIPVLFVHGGPGAGCAKSDRCFFDPGRYRIILFDQRGSGRSEPHAGLEANNTQALIADMEKIRESLAIDKWVIFGGSWGSTLSLVYAETYPNRVLAMILRGIFLCRNRDIHWFYQEGASAVFPDYWREFIEPIPENERSDMLRAYHRRLTGDNELERMSAAKHWATWEAQCATLDPNVDVVERFANPHTAMSLSRIEAHYFVNGCFLEDDQILRNIENIRAIPAYIVHGRYDIVCPVEQAFALAEGWPEAELDIIRDAGHASSEPGIVDALVRATDQVADNLF
ncbi:MAG: prolyl aminopeptidase, partial [bacterium]